MLRQLGTKVNKAVAFCAKELLLTMSAAGFFGRCVNNKLKPAKAMRLNMLMAFV